MSSDFSLENTGFDVSVPLWHTSGYSFVNDLRFRKCLEVTVYSYSKRLFGGCQGQIRLFIFF
jgi:hypothetical protein